MGFIRSWPWIERGTRSDPALQAIYRKPLTMRHLQPLNPSNFARIRCMGVDLETATIFITGVYPFQRRDHVVHRVMAVD
jgi:hypothetical protein